ncbi:MAG: TonB-dependent receptor [Gammaproteobacteria bacterium]|nr:MAG: TonB-dependent receptor [Gammaproteobacteria bacterium]
MSNIFPKTSLSLTLIFLAISTISHAEIHANNEPIATLPTVIVTATCTPTKTSNLIAETTVIDSVDLQKYQGQTVFDVLKNQADISTKQNGGMGTVGNFYLRGYDNKHILILIDGIRYSSVSTGQSALNLLPTSKIERIEILKGASGVSIYGADAMGGVIQIFTKKGQQNNAFSASIGAGTNNHYSYGATANFANDNTNLLLSANHTQTDGINATTPQNYSYNSDKDSFNSDNFGLALHHKASDKLNFGLSALYSNSKVDFDDGMAKQNTHSKNKNGSAQVFGEYQYADNSSLKLQYGQSIDKSESFNTAWGDSDYNTNQQQINLIGKHQLPLGKVTYGGEYLQQKLKSSAYQADDRKVKSIFTGYQLAKDKLDLQANIRHDKNSQYGNKTTYNFGVAYRPLKNLRIGTSYATGFNMPSFNDLYYPNSGNPNLQAETSKNIETFAEYQMEKNKTRLTAYHNRVDNMIAWQKTKPNDPNDWNGTMKNINKVNIEGVSVNSDWNFDNYLFGLGYDYQKVTDNKKMLESKINKNYGKFINYRPKHKGLIYAGYQADNFDIRGEYQYTGDSYTDNANTNKLQGYGLVNFAGNYYLNDSLTLNARINNLTNKNYVNIPNYNTQGTNVFVGLTYDY